MLDFFELRGAVLVAIVAVCLAGGHVCGEILMVPYQVSAGPDDGYELNDD